MSTRWSVLSLSFLAFGPSLAFAQAPEVAVPAVVAPEAPAVVAPEDAEPGKKKKKKKGDDAGEPDAVAVDAGPVALEFRGRVFAGGQYVDRVLIPTVAGGPEISEEGMKLEVPSARGGVKARIHDFITLALEVDFAPKAELKDAFIQAKRKHWSAKAGQFKMPVSAFNLESPWSLPLARRGAIHNLLSDSLQIIGRRPGAMGQIRGSGDWDPALTLGMFQGLDFASFKRVQREVDRSTVTEKTFVGRLSATPSGHEFALVGLIHGAKATPSVLGMGGKREFKLEAGGNSVTPVFTRLWTVGAEGTLDWQFETTGLRLWSEAYFGTQVLDEFVDSSRQAKYVAARALGAFRFGGMSKGESYIEPSLMLGAFDPDLDVVSDLAWETIAGLTIGHWRETRLTFQVEYARMGRNMSREFFLDNKGEPTPIVKQHMAAVLEAGAAF